MTEPRFVVTTLTGYGKTRRKLTTSWYVVDRLWCYRVMRKFHNGWLSRKPNMYGYGGGEQAAHRYADYLNREYG